MFKNYLTITLRLMQRKPGFTLLNLGGLAVGYACCLLISLYVIDELTFDQFHTNHHRIYRVGTHVTFKNGNQQRFVTTTRMLANHLCDSFPEVEQACIMYRSRPTIFHQGKALRGLEGYAADSSLFTMFNFPLAKGNPEHALSGTQQIVLTHSTAQLLFGNEDPMGQQLILYDSIPFTISGVLAPYPSNSSLRFQFLLSGSFRETSIPRGPIDWIFLSFEVYMMLRDGAALEPIIQATDSIIYRKIPEQVTRFESNPQLVFIPLANLHFQPPIPGTGSYLRRSSERLIIYALASIALFILIIASANYMNLATARSTERAREIGIRKLVGAHRRLLVRQLLTESAILAIGALIVALVLSSLALPAFNALSGKSFTLQVLHSPQLLLASSSLALFVGLLSGLYPAFYISRHQTVAVLKGTFRHGRKGSLLRKTLVVIQFALSMGMLVHTMVANSQLRYMLKKDLGYNAHQLWAVNTEAVPTQLLLADSLQALPRLQAASNTALTYSGHIPSAPLMMQAIAFTKPNGQQDGVTMRTYSMAPGHTEFLEIPLLAGRRSTPADSSGTCLITKSAALAMGFTTPEEALGTTIVHFDSGSVVGVVEDYHHYGTNQAIQPVLFVVSPTHNHLCFRISEEEDPQALKALEETWEQLFPQYPYTANFLASRYTGYYRANRQQLQVVSALTTMANLLAIMGLLGLASYSIAQRKKEISIRKAVGASVRGITWQLTREFSVLIGIALGVTVPLTLWAVGQWLAQFPYAIPLTPWPFLIAGSLAIGLVWGITATLAYRAAHTNITNALKND